MNNEAQIGRKLGTTLKGQTQAEAEKKMKMFVVEALPNLVISVLLLYLLYCPK